MKILALEFSSGRRSVAVTEANSGKAVIAGVSDESGNAQTKPFALIESALNQARWSRSDIDCVAVGLGPGSYTGIRVAISIAQGWQLAREVKLLGISAVECLAFQEISGGRVGRINIAIDAHRNEFYLASGGADISPRQFAESLQLVSAEEVERLFAAGQTVLGPDLQSRFPKAEQIWPEASALAQLAAGRSDFVGGEQLEPIYLRPTSFIKAPPSRLVL